MENVIKKTSNALQIPLWRGIFLFFSLSLWANEPYYREQKYTEIKKINKEFQVGSSSSLFVSNRYGDITFLTDVTLKDKIKIEVEIKASANNLSDAQSRIKQITVDFNQKSSDVLARTIIEQNNSFFKGFGKKSSINIQINYKISLPVKTQIIVENKYGNIFLNKTERDLKIDAEYGGLQLGEIWANAELDLEYITKANISIAKRVDLETSYSTISIEKADRIDLKASYSNFKIGNIKQVEANLSYGIFDINETDFLNLDGDYTNIAIGKVSNQLSVENDYGTIVIKEILPTTKSVNVNSSYANVSINYHPDWSFDYHFSTSFASLNVPKNLPFTEKNKRMMSNTLKGNKGKSDNVFRVESDYGGVTITEKL